jgi:hypothetical protein
LDAFQIVALYSWQTAHIHWQNGSEWANVCRNPGTVRV